MFHTQGLVIKTEDTNEYDQFVTCYTKDFGKLKLLAKGINKPESRLRGHLDLFDFSDFMIVSGKNRNYVRSAMALEKFQNIKSDLRLFALASVTMELLEKGTFENSHDYETWNLNLRFLNHLNSVDFSDRNYYGSLLYTYIKEFFRIHGHLNGDLIAQGENTLDFYLEKLNRFSISKIGESLDSLHFFKTII